MTVTNDGEVPEAMRAQLFQPFHKGDAGARGLGLGLFIVREIVTAHGGSVELASAPDEPRTCFTTDRPRHPRPAS